MNRLQQWFEQAPERRIARENKRRQAQIDLEASGLLGYMHGTKPAPSVRPPSVVERERLAANIEPTIPLFDVDLLMNAAPPAPESPNNQ